MDELREKIKKTEEKINIAKNNEEIIKYLTEKIEKELEKPLKKTWEQKIRKFIERYQR